MPYGNLFVDNVSLSLASLSIHHVEDARRSARRAHIRYLQLRTRDKFDYSPAFNGLWRFWEEEADAEVEDMKNSSASAYTLKKTKKRESDCDDDAGAGGAGAVSA